MEASVIGPAAAKKYLKPSATEKTQPLASYYERGTEEKRVNVPRASRQVDALHARIKKQTAIETETARQAGQNCYHSALRCEFHAQKHT